MARDRFTKLDDEAIQRAQAALRDRFQFTLILVALDGPQCDKAGAWLPFHTGHYAGAMGLLDAACRQRYPAMFANVEIVEDDEPDDSTPDSPA